MKRLYLRLVFKRVEEGFYLVNSLKTMLFNLVKPAVYQKKMRKVLELNRTKLTKKQDAFNSKIQKKTAISMNFIR